MMRSCRLSASLTIFKQCSAYLSYSSALAILSSPDLQLPSGNFHNSPEGVNLVDLPGSGVGGSSPGISTRDFHLVAYRGVDTLQDGRRILIALGQMHPALRHCKKAVPLLLIRFLTRKLCAKSSQCVALSNEIA